MTIGRDGPDDPAPTSAPRRRGRPRRGTTAPGPQRAEEFLGIAVGVIWRNGYAATRIGDIAKAAGVANASLYHHFRSKDEIYARVVDRLCALFEREARIGVEGTAVERLERFLRCRIEVVLFHREELALFNRDLPRIRGEAGDRARDVAAQSWTMLRGILLHGQQEGSFRIANPDVGASMILGCLSFLPTWHVPEQAVSNDQWFSELIAYVTRGVVVRSPGLPDVQAESAST